MVIIQYYSLPVLGPTSFNCILPSGKYQSLPALMFLLVHYIPSTAAHCNNLPRQLLLYSNISHQRNLVSPVPNTWEYKNWPEQGHGRWMWSLIWPPRDSLVIWFHPFTFSTQLWPSQALFILAVWPPVWRGLQAHGGARPMPFPWHLLDLCFKTPPNGQFINVIFSKWSLLAVETTLTWKFELMLNRLYLPL